MFVFGLNKQELESAIEQNNFALIGKHLFRVRNLTSGLYWFDHHLQTKPSISIQDKKLFKVIQCSSSSFKGIKVRVSNTGKIQIIND